MFITNPLSKSLASVITVIFLSACSQNTQDLKDTIELTFFGNKDVVVTPAYVEELPYASIYAKVGDYPRAFVVLGFVEPSFYDKEKSFQLKWASSSGEMLTTENGRVIKTLKFANGNLERSYANRADPISLGLLSSSTPKTWTRYVDWQPGNYNHIRLDSQFTLANQEQIDINGTLVLAQHVIEQVHVPDLNISYQNQFWLDLNTQQVIASSQRPAPLLSEIEIQLLKLYIGS